MSNREIRDAEETPLNTCDNQDILVCEIFEIFCYQLRLRKLRFIISSLCSRGIRNEHKTL